MQTYVEKTSNVVAMASVSTLFVPPWLEQASQYAATIAPILGVAWLIWQFGWSIYKSIKKAKVD